MIKDKDLNNLGANVRYQKQKVTMWVLVVHLYFASDLGPSMTTSAKRYSFFSNGER